LGLGGGDEAARFHHACEWLGGWVAARSARAAGGDATLIGLLDVRSPETMGDRLVAFRQGLKETGFVEGDNVTIAYRWAENRTERLPELAADLVRLKAAVITTGGPPAAFAAKAATTTIPTLFVVADDPVLLGLVASLGRPAGNLTGINLFNSELSAKRLALLHELLPQAKHVAVLVDPADTANTAATLREIDPASRAIGLQIKIFNASSSREIDAAFEAIANERQDAVFVGASPFLNGQHVELARLAAFHRIPASYSPRESVEVGGLMSYGANIADAYRQLGVYAGRIVKGAKPADLPVVQATKFELVINARTARMLGITVPPTLLSTADRVIE
jgi:putative tryptophan/tyrosine transport system substrate-binding protein